nr:RidA family protein [Rhodococcus wratislaviensis]GLK40222.1 LysR family transcriptional regulator [Rhodococcus wratislaviensis]
MPTWTEKLSSIALHLPQTAVPLAAYVPANRVGNLVQTSGQIPLVEGTLPIPGKVGTDVDVIVAIELARVCALNALAAVDDLVGIDSIVRVVKVVGYVASAPDFTNQPAVVNGASDLLAEVFGDKAAHIRSAVGVAVLPLDAPVEIELVVEVDTDHPGTI